MIILLTFSESFSNISFENGITVNACLLQTRPILLGFLVPHPGDNLQIWNVVMFAVQFTV
jgi:hypothetical protein